MSNVVDWLVTNEPEFSEKRLPSLYSDLAQQRSANPDGFVANATAWEHALTRAALAGQLSSTQKITLRSSDELINTFRSARYGQPTGLGLVLDEAIKKSKMMPVSDFHRSDVSIYQNSWVPNLGSVLQWALRQAGLGGTRSYDDHGRLRTGELVLLDGMEKLAKQVCAEQALCGDSLSDRIMTREDFSQMVARTETGQLTPAETEYLLRFLSRDKQLLAYDSNTVKFKEFSAPAPESISMEDKSIASLKSLIASLNVQISQLNGKITNFQENAQSAVRAKNRISALSALRSKKAAERALEQRNNTLEQLEGVFSKIQEAVDQVQIIEVMQSSANTLKSLNHRVGGVDRVDSIMEDLREQMAETEEVGQIINEPLNDKIALDDAELDDEIEAMQREEAEKKEQLEADATKKRLDVLKSLGNPIATKTDDNAALDAELESSSQKLARIKLDDDENVAPIKISENSRVPEKLLV